MKIGVYDTYINTGGGGEKYVGVIIDELAKYNHVEIITSDRNANLENVAKRLNLDFKNVSLKFWPHTDEEYLSELTEEYDLFINSTYNSFIKSRAKHSAMVVFFPIVLYKRIPVFIKKFVFGSLDLLFGNYYNSFHLVSSDFTVKKNCITLTDKNLGIITKEPTNEVVLYTNFFFDQKYIVPKENEYSIHFDNQNLIIRANTAKDRFDIEFTPQFFEDKLRINAIKVNSSFRSKLTIQLISREDLLSKFFNKVYGVYVNQRISLQKLEHLDTYDDVIVISEYTKEWLEKLYGIKNSFLLFPPIQVEEFNPGEKKNIILSIGRFFDPQIGHNKRQLEMIKIFKEMYTKYESELRGYEYHLCGGVSDDESSVKYLDDCKKEAKGFPIFFHPNIPFQALKKLTGEAKIFWHASGYGLEKDKEPERFEHFGMTTVEAMSAGVVPVVINAGGQSEIMNEGVNGYVWDNKEELIDKTIKLATDRDLLEKLKDEAITSSRKYSKDKMEERIRKLFPQFTN